jgi:putative hemolysin
MKPLVGFVTNFLGRIPAVHDVVSVNGVRITVLSMEGKRAGRLLISRALSKNFMREFQL